MEVPSVKTTYKDTENGITYEVMAYRKLTEEETVLAIRNTLSLLKKSKRPKRGQTLTILTVLR